MKDTFGKRLRWLREDSEMTLREFADQVAADPGYLSKLETGKAKNASGRFLTRVVVAFRVNPVWLADGTGDPFASPSKDERTRKSLPGWSEKRLQRIMAVLRDLPDALATDAVLGHLLRNLSLEELQEVWHGIPRFGDLPVPARLFWNEVFMRCQFPKVGYSSKKQDLTDSSELVRSSGDVKIAPQWPELKKRLQKATEAIGAKPALAKVLKVDPTQISQWLSDSKSAREPGGEYALQLQAWLNDPKRPK